MLERKLHDKPVILLIIILLAASVLLFSSCSNSQSPSDDPSQSESENGTENTSLTTEGFPLALNWLQEDKYYMSYTIHLNYPDFAYDMDCVMAADGDNFVFQSESEVPIIGYTKSRLLETNGMSYLVDDVNEVCYELGPSESESEAQSFAGLVPLGSGKEQLDGFIYNYQDFASNGEELRFYFTDDNQLYAIKSAVFTVDSTLQESMDGDGLIIINEISNVIPSGYFDIPKGYVIVK